MTDLTAKHCKSCEGGVDPLDRAQAEKLMGELVDHWKLADDTKQIRAEFRFGDFDRTMAFINAVAWIAHQEDHHPDVAFGYNYAHVRYSTHAIGGLSENDFICAAKIDALLS